VGDPARARLRIRHHAIGLNYIDVYQRSGVYRCLSPLVLGNEGAGVIEAVATAYAPKRATARPIAAGRRARMRWRE
jgi:NADPH2:quinone reductase